MAKYDLPTETIKFKGIFDMELLYKSMRDWLTRRGYYFEEPTYKCKLNPLGGKEDEITWKSYKKETDYFKFWIVIDFHTWERKDIEVIEKGKKKKMNQARMTIYFNSYVESDWQGRWQSTPFLQWLNSFYEKYIIKPEIENIYTDKLYYYVLKLHNIAKECLGMEAKGSEYGDVW